MLACRVRTFQPPGVKHSDRGLLMDHDKSQTEAYFKRDATTSTPGDFAIAAVRPLDQLTF